jgi:hypothetical protein
VPASKNGVARQSRHHYPVLGGLTHHAALAHGSAPDLELGLHQGHRVPARGEDAEHGGQDLFQRDEGHVDHGQGRRLVEQPPIEGPRVGVLHHHHPLVGPELDVQLRRPDVHG